MSNFELRCIKTGRHWPAASESAARRAACHLGLVDYEIIPREAIQ